MKTVIAMFVLAVGLFAQAPSNEVFGSAGISFPRTPTITTTFSAIAGVGHTVATESFGSTSIIGTYNFVRQTPTGGVHAFLGGVKQNFKSTIPNVTPFVTAQAGTARLLNVSNPAFQIGGGLRFSNVLPQGFGLDFGVTGTKILDSKPAYGGLFVGLSKSF